MQTEPLLALTPLGHILVLATQDILALESLVQVGQSSIRFPFFFAPFISSVCLFIIPLLVSPFFLFLCRY